MAKPFSFVMPMDAKKFAALHDALSKNNPSQNPIAQDRGTIQDPDLDLDWTYTDNTLRIDITAIHSMKARLATQSMIQQRIQSMIDNFQA